MLTGVEKMWITMKARSIILFVCTVGIAYCTMAFWVYKFNLETIIWTLFTEIAMTVTLSWLHYYCDGLIWVHKRRYQRRQADVIDNDSWEYMCVVVGVLWLLMSFSYAHTYFSHLEENRDDQSTAAFLGSITLVVFLISSGTSAFFTRGIWVAYRTLILHPVPEPGMEMPFIPPPGIVENHIQ